MYTESVPRWQQFHMAPALQQPKSTVSTPLGWILKTCSKKLRSLIQNHTRQECSESAREQRTALHKGEQQTQQQRDQQKQQQRDNKNNKEIHKNNKEIHKNNKEIHKKQQRDQLPT